MKKHLFLFIWTPQELKEAWVKQLRLEDTYLIKIYFILPLATVKGMVLEH